MQTEPSAVILAGGRARRMDGEDKGLLRLAGKPLLAHVLQRLRPQVGEIFISANRNLERYREFGCPVIRDLHGGYPGPLAGIAAALRRCATPELAVVPCDAPLLPADLVRRLHEALRESRAPCSVAHDGESLQPLFALFRKEAEPALAGYLEQGKGEARRWHRLHGSVVVEFPAGAEAFLNINTPEQLRMLEARLTKKAPMG